MAPLSSLFSLPFLSNAVQEFDALDADADDTFDDEEEQSSPHEDKYLFLEQPFAHPPLPHTVPNHSTLHLEPLLVSARRESVLQKEEPVSSPDHQTFLKPRRLTPLHIPDIEPPNSPGVPLTTSPISAVRRSSERLAAPARAPSLSSQTPKARRPSASRSPEVVRGSKSMDDLASRSSGVPIATSVDVDDLPTHLGLDASERPVHRFPLRPHTRTPKNQQLIFVVRRRR